MSRGNQQAVGCLLLVLVLYVLLWLVYPQEFIASDPWLYSTRAFEISRGFQFGDGHVFDHRLGVTIPVAVSYAVLGVGITTTNMWPLCAALLIIVTVWVALPTASSKMTGAVICLTSIPLFKSSLALYPDGIAAAFMALSSLLLFERKRLIQANNASLLVTSGAVSLLFVAFLAKESAYWVLPLWIYAALTDMKSSERALLMRQFYLPLIATGTFLGVAYLGFCYTIWGDPLARFKSVQSLTGQHLWSWEDATIRDYIKRLTIAPIRLLTSQYSAHMLFFALCGFVIAPPSIRQWRYYTACCILFYWFGSTSFTRYEPMPLMERMTLPALPGIYILGAFVITRLASYLSTFSRRLQHAGAVLPLLLVVCFTGSSFVAYIYSWKNITLAEANVMAIVQQEIKDNPEKKYLLISSDSRSPASLSFYFDYHYPDNLKVVSVAALTTDLLTQADKEFVFLDKSRSEFLASAYGNAFYDKEIEALNLVPLYYSGDVVLFTAERKEQLENLIVLNDR